MKNLILFLFLAGAAAAQTPPAEDPLLKQLLDRDRARNGGTKVSDGPPPIFDALWGDLGTANAAGPVATGQDFLRTFGPLLGFTANFNLQNDVTALSEKKNARGTHVVFAPAVQGVPYVDAQFAMDFDPQGNLVGVSGRYDAPTGAKLASIDAKTAVKNAIRELARKFPGLTPSKGGEVEEYLELTPQNTIEHRFGVVLILGDQRRQRRVVVGLSGEILSEGPDDTGAHP